DLWIRTGYDERTGSGAVTLELRAGDAAFPVRLRMPELDIDVEWAEASAVAPLHIDKVEPWTAESPRLYDATVVSRDAAE
ncbi:hypothetical protein SB767_35600, partial [Bacillus sp. SIMBA_069]